MLDFATPPKMNGGRQVFDWTPERMDLLTALWGEGLSCSKIGKHLGISAHAVIGKAHRILLPPRPSPIKRIGPFKKSKFISAPRVAKPVKINPTPVKTRMVRMPIGDLPLSRVHKCQWIENDPKVDPSKCGQPAAEGKFRFCPEHLARCFRSDTVKVKSAA